MRRLLAARGTSAAAVGVLVLLVAGGGYALAGSGSGKITVCVSHKGGALYKAKKCAKHDKKLTWNKVGRAGRQGPKGDTGNTGPQGPGAISLVYNVAGSASTTPAAIGNLGPYTLTGTCTTAAGSTQFTVYFSGPGVQVDGFGNQSSGPFSQSAAIAGPLSNAFFADTASTTSQDVFSDQSLLIPSGSSPFEALITLSAAGMTPPSDEGLTPNTCRFSATITPVAAPTGASAAIRPTPAGKFTGPLLGKH